MTTTPLPPLPPAAKEWCEESCVYFTPADPKYGPLAMQAYATQARADLEAELQQWKNVFGHLGTADECGNEWIRLQDENQRLRRALTACYPIVQHEKFVQDASYGKNFSESKSSRAQIAYELTRTALEKQP